MHIHTPEDMLMASQVEDRYQQAKHLCSEFTLQLPYTFKRLFKPVETGIVAYYKEAKVTFVKPSLKVQVEELLVAAEETYWKATERAAESYAAGKISALNDVFGLLKQQGPA